MANQIADTSPFSFLPEGCIANIISFTSPRDACRAAAVSLGFKSAADSDTVWERFLPPDCRNILSGSSSPTEYSSKKELYFMLSDSGLLLHGGKLSFRLCKSSGKKCYTLCARELQIVWADTPIYWKWTSLPESRFSEVAELLNVCWLEIRGTFNVQKLSPNTNYVAFLVFKLSEKQYGLDCSSTASVEFLSESTKEIEGETGTVYIVRPTYSPVIGRRWWSRVPVRNIDGRVSRTRADGWMELELGKFFVAEGDEGDVRIQLLETERLGWKKGLIVEGIELRPTEMIV